MSGQDVLLDLIHQDHRVAHNHAEQRDHTELCHEAEGGMEQQQRGGDADQPEGGGEHHQQGALETLQLDHQQGQHGDDGEGKHGADGALRVARFLRRAADVDTVTGR